MTATSGEVSGADDVYLSTRTDADLRALIALRRRTQDDKQAEYLRAKYHYEAAVDELHHRRRSRSA